MGKVLWGIIGAAALCLAIGCSNGRGEETAFPTVVAQASVAPTSQGGRPTVASSTPSLPTKAVPATSTALPVPSTTTAPLPAVTSTATNSPTPTPHPMAAYTIAGLRERDYQGGRLNIRALLDQNETFTRYYVDYPSGGLTITGIMQAPPGDGPFPVIILNHGYFDRGQYYSGADTSQAAEFLNRRGYLTIAPDYRSWGESDSGSSFFHTGLVIDVLNLISALPTVAQADVERIGLWGHSMGGGITTKVLTVDERARAAVLYAPNSANDADILARWGPGCAPGQSEATHKCNPAEVIPPDLPASDWNAYLSAAGDPDMLRQIAPIYHLDNVVAPVQIHIGTADGAGNAETPPSWSTSLYEALEAAGREATLFQYEGEGHFFAGQAWALFMERTADFFNAQLRSTEID